MATDKKKKKKEVKMRDLKPSKDAKGGGGRLLGSHTGGHTGGHTGSNLSSGKL
jgi:hypothetical protein